MGLLILLLAVFLLSGCGSKSSLSGDSGDGQPASADLAAFCKAKNGGEKAIKKLQAAKNTGNAKYTAAATKAMTDIGRSIGMLSITTSKVGEAQRATIAKANSRFRAAYSQVAPQINDDLATKRYAEVAPLVVKLSNAFDSAYSDIDCS